MTDNALEQKIITRKQTLAKRLITRHRAEKRFRLIGLISIFTALSFLLFLLVNIISNGYSAFWQHYVKLEIMLEQSAIDPQNTKDPAILKKADYNGLIKQALRDQFPEVSGRKNRRELYSLVSSNAAFQLMDEVIASPERIGSRQTFWFLASDDIDMLMKGYIDRTLPESDRRISDQSLSWIDQLIDKNAIKAQFNSGFFTYADSREPEMAGVMGAVMGSFWLLLVTFLISFPLGVAAAIHLEEFAPRNRFTDLIEVNINNLAAVPSIVFGLLGLAVFLNLFGLPRSSPVVGGLVLSLMTLPTIIIASRASLKSVPPSIREAALGMGASRVQMIFHHVLPLAMPGILTGSIIGMAGALGETAPLLMIGMVAFIMSVPAGVTDAATALPVQIYLWADSPERAFVEKTSAAIMVLLAFLIIMNLSAILLRRKFSRRW